MKHLTTYGTFILLVLSFNISFGQALSKKEKEIIHTEAVELIKSYETALNKIAENISSDEAAVTGLKNEFIGLFLNRQVQIYNDLEPNHLYSEFYEVETYISNLALWYPDGMQVSFNYSEIQTPGIYNHKDNIWYLDLHATKKINGNYMNRQLNQNTEELSFRIAFVKNKKKVSNFKIVGIRNVNSANLLTDEKALKELNKAEYTADEEVSVHQSAKSLLMDYIRSLELIGNPDEKDENKEFYTYDFLSLFESEESRVLNDIEPGEEESQIDLKDYIQNYQANYPAGITNIALNLDSARFSHIEKTEDGRFQTFVYVEKFFSGNFEGKQKLSQAAPLIFTISMDRSEGVFQNILIKGIDKEYTDFTGINTVNESEQQEIKAITPITKTGNYIGLSYMGGLSKINSQNLNELNPDTIGGDGHSWTTEPLYGYSIGLDFLLFKNEKYGFSTGIKYSQYKTNYRLEGEFVSQEQEDFNNNLYVNRVNAQLDSTVTLNYLSVPIQIKYIHRFNRNYAFYFNTGINISFLYHAEYELSGQYSKFSYYTDSPDDPQWENLRITGFSDFGDVTIDYNVPKTGRPDLKAINLVGVLSFGLNIRTGYYSSIQFGPKLLFGLTSITKGDVYSDIFGNTHEAKATRTNNFGFEFSYIRKL